ncbi:MAG: ABC transporter permease [Chloroflexi bacterium]|nr:ABC transporter permease [Chloroflexota bacterium]
MARVDYKDQTFNKFELLSGQWPTRKGLAVEKGAEANFNIHEGDQVYLRINDHERVLPVEGVAYNRTADPPGFGGNAQFYASRDEFANLTGEQDFDQILASAPVYNEAAVKDLADRMQRQLEKLNIDTSGAAPGDGDNRISDPQEHFLQSILDAIFLILGVMGALALVLGLLLVYNTITAIIGQQVGQIGVMKAIGASTGQILWVYFSGVLIYSVLALVVAIPLSAIGAQQLSNFLLGFFNMDPGPLTLSSLALEAEGAIALLAPLLASLVPVFAGARITVREAISTSVQDSVAYTFGDVLFSILRFNVSLQF